MIASLLRGCKPRDPVCVHRPTTAAATLDSRIPPARHRTWWWLRQLIALFPWRAAGHIGLDSAGGRSALNLAATRSTSGCTHGEQLLGLRLPCIHMAAQPPREASISSKQTRHALLVNEHPASLMKGASICAANSDSTDADGSWKPAQTQEDCSFTTCGLSCGEKGPTEAFIKDRA